MGDIADDIIDGFWDDSEGYWDVPFGCHEDEEAYYPSGPRLKTCQFCGKTDLIWRLHDGKWKLWDSELHDYHTCPKVTGKQRRMIDKFRRNMFRKLQEGNQTK